MPAPFGNLNNTAMWPDEHVDMLRDLFAKGIGDSRMADELNRRFHTRYSRNSVIGKRVRIGLLVEQKPNLPVRAPKRPSRPAHVPAPRINPVELRALRCVEIIPRNVSLIDLEPGDCRYPYGDGPFVFCGHPKFGDAPYCGPHLRLCTGIGTTSERAATKGMAA